MININDKYQWKPIVGYEKDYLASRNGEIYSLISKRKLKPSKTTWGYYKVGLLNKDRKQTFHFIHRLILMAFGVPTKGKIQVNHINGIKTDNRLENLEWCTQSENLRHAYRNGLLGNCAERFNKCRPRYHSWDNPTRKLTIDKVKEIRRTYKKGVVTYAELGKKYGVSGVAIGDIIRKSSWNDF